MDKTVGTHAFTQEVIAQIKKMSLSQRARLRHALDPWLAVPDVKISAFVRSHVERPRWSSLTHDEN
jgi:hypothetical protein